MMMTNLMWWWRAKAFECPMCGWQGMAEPTQWGDAECPECSERMTRRSWRDTWGLTLVILGVVLAAVCFVAYFGQG
jgi:hypothetical protein